MKPSNLQMQGAKSGGANRKMRFSTLFQRPADSGGTLFVRKFYEIITRKEDQ